MSAESRLCGVFGDGFDRGHSHTTQVRDALGQYGGDGNAYSQPGETSRPGGDVHLVQVRRLKSVPDKKFIELRDELDGVPAGGFEGDALDKFIADAQRHSAAAAGGLNRNGYRTVHKEMDSTRYWMSGATN